MRIRKVMSCFVVFLILIMPLQAHAEELQGMVTSIALDEKAPYAGILLDPVAASKMLVDKKYSRIEIELNLRKEFQKELTEKRLSYDLLKIDYESLRKIHEETMLLKEKQISDLNLMLKEEMKPDHTHWWIFGGVAVGIVLSLGVFYASVVISK